MADRGVDLGRAAPAAAAGGDVAMQFTDEVHWTGFDFVFAGVMIGGTGLAYELAVRASGSLAYRAGVAVALAASFLLIWVNGAVGIIGDEDNPANLMYGGVLAAALVGAIVARFRAAGLMRAMLVAASGQALVAAIALIGGLGASEPPGPIGILALNGFFVLLWLFSAFLFRKAKTG
jgi:hypothetical protein